MQIFILTTKILLWISNWLFCLHVSPKILNIPWLGTTGIDCFISVVIKWHSGENFYFSLLKMAIAQFLSLPLKIDCMVFTF